MPDPGPSLQIPSFAGFACSGVYFLQRDGVVVYVGQAKNMRRRIGEHISEGAKAFDTVSCRPCPVEHLDRVEAHFIERLVPEYNQCTVAKAARFQSQCEIRPSRHAICGHKLDHNGLTKRQRRKVRRYGTASNLVS